MTPPDDAITITFPQPAPLLNMNSRQHWAVKGREVAAWRKAARIAAWHHFGALRPDRQQLAPSFVMLTIDVPDRRRRDPSNLTPCTKACVDGLVESLRLWPDDDARWVTTIEPRLRVSRDHTITIHIWPRGDAA
jgi:hypothetical protein